MRLTTLLLSLSLGLSTLPEAFAAEPPQGELLPSSSELNLRAHWWRMPQPQEATYSIRRRTNWLGLGGILLRESYLSPLRYGGIDLMLLSEQASLGYRADTLTPREASILALRPRQETPTRMYYRQQEVHLSSSDNPAGNASIYRLSARGDWHYTLRLPFVPQGRLYVGPGVSAGLGGLYSTRNGNNPATLKADLSLTLALHYSYRLPWESFPALLRLSSQTELLGLHFAQHFGESYYELYYLSGSLARRFVFTQPTKAWAERLMVSMDLPVWDHFTLSLGYRWEHRASELHHITHRISSHSLMLGITTHSIRIGGRRSIHRQRERLPF